MPNYFRRLRLPDLAEEGYPALLHTIDRSGWPLCRGPPGSPCGPWPSRRETSASKAMILPSCLALVSPATKTVPSWPSWWKAFRPEQVGKTGLSSSGCVLLRSGACTGLPSLVTSGARRVVLLILESNAMEQPTKEQIVHRAYELWEQAGKPEGRDDEFYHLAEQELRNADKSSPLRTPDNL